MVLAVVLIAAALSLYSIFGATAASKQPANSMRFVVLLVLAVVSARMKVRLPGIESTMCMNLPFILIGIIELGLQRALIVGAASTLVQCLPLPGKPWKPVQILFNVCNVWNATAVAFVAANRALHIQNIAATPLFLVAAAGSFFLADTVPVAGIIAATSNGNVWRVWREISGLTFPYFVLSAGAATIVVTAGYYYPGWIWPGFLLLMYGVYSSFKRYFRQTAPQKGPVTSATPTAKPASESA